MKSSIWKESGVVRNNINILLNKNAYLMHLLVILEKSLLKL